MNNASSSQGSCGPVDCANCPLRAHSIFSDLDAAQVAALTAGTTSREYGRGEIIFAPGDSPAGIYCIRHGKVRLYTIGHEGKEQVIRLAAEGDILGYRAFLSGEHYRLWAEPIETSFLCHIPQGTIRSFIFSSLNFSTRLMGLLSNDLRHAEEMIVEMAHRPVRERMAETLLTLKATYGTESDQQTIDVSMTRAELANVVGTAMETVSRQLAKFKREGIVDFIGRRIRILDGSALVRAANLDS